MVVLLRKEDMVEKIKSVMYEEMGVEPRIKVFAFGGAAGRMAEFIAAQGIAGLKVIAVNVDKNVSGLNVDKKLLLGKEVLVEHTDTAGEPRVAEYVVSKSEKWILEELDTADAVVLIGALGGGMGTGGLIEAMRILKRKSTKPMMSLVILPFSAEREHRARAMEALNTIKEEELGTYFVLDSDDMLKNKNMNIFEAYRNMYYRGAMLVANLSELTGRILREKFDSIFMSEVNAIVDEKMESMEFNAEIYA